MQAYNLQHLFDAKGFIYVEIQRGMYGLQQAGCLAYDQLKTFLVPHGYRLSLYAIGIWLHDTKPISFTLIVDNFGVKYINKQDAQDLMAILNTHYEAVTEDWKGTVYAGIHLHWD